MWRSLSVFPTLSEPPSFTQKKFMFLSKNIQRWVSFSQQWRAFKVYFGCRWKRKASVIHSLSNFIFEKHQMRLSLLFSVCFYNKVLLRKESQCYCLLSPLVTILMSLFAMLVIQCKWGKTKHINFIVQTDKTDAFFGYFLEQRVKLG